MSNLFKNFTSRDYLAFSIFLMAIVLLAITTIVAFVMPSVWSDEIFSLVLVKLSPYHFFRLIFKDVHPPLYYFILRAFVSLLTPLGVNEIIIGHIVSIIPVYLLLIIGYFKLKKEFGFLTYAIFAFAIVSMPKFMIYATEIRMYSWAMFFLTASFIYLYFVLKKPSWKNWGIFTFFSICSAYTHYYSALGSVVLYVLVLGIIIYKKRELLKKFIISAIVCILAYVPWIFKSISQLTSKQSFWINPIGFKTIVSYFYYVFDPNKVYIINNGLIAPSILGTVLIVTIIGLLVFSFKNKLDFKMEYAYLAIFLAFIVPFIGLVISFIKYPLLHYRYLFPAMGCFWLGFSILLAKSNKKVFVPILIIFLIIGIVGCIGFVDVKSDALEKTEGFNQTMHGIFPENSIVFFDCLDWMMAGFFINDTSIVFEFDPTQDDIYRLKEEYNASGVYYVENFKDYLNQTDIKRELVFTRVNNPYNLQIDIGNVYKLA